MVGCCGCVLKEKVSWHSCQPLYPRSQQQLLTCPSFSHCHNWLLRSFIAILCVCANRKKENFFCVAVAWPAMAKVKGVEKGRPKVDAGMRAPSHDSWLLTLASVCFVCFIDACFLYLFSLFFFFFFSLKNKINICLFPFLVIWQSVLLNMYGHAFPLIFVLARFVSLTVFDCGCECKRS